MRIRCEQMPLRPGLAPARRAQARPTRDCRRAGRVASRGGLKPLSWVSDPRCLDRQRLAADPGQRYQRHRPTAPRFAPRRDRTTQRSTLRHRTAAVAQAGVPRGHAS